MALRRGLQPKRRTGRNVLLTLIVLGIGVGACMLYEYRRIFGPRPPRRDLDLIVINGTNGGVRCELADSPVAQVSSWQHGRFRMWLPETGHGQLRVVSADGSVLLDHAVVAGHYVANVGERYECASYEVAYEGAYRPSPFMKWKGQGLHEITSYGRVYGIHESAPQTITRRKGEFHSPNYYEVRMRPKAK